MQGYTAIARMLELADDFGEAQVIRDVAHRAGVLWTCVNDGCGRDNIGHGTVCERCSSPAPDPDPLPGEWQCECMAVNVRPICAACHRQQPNSRRSQPHA